VIALKMVEILLAGAANISVRSEAVQHQRDRSTEMTMIKMISVLMTRLLVNGDVSLAPGSDEGV